MLRRRIVTEVRQVEVTVRREELVVEHTASSGITARVAADDTDDVGGPSAARRLPLVIVLSEEVPTLQLVTRPYERVPSTSTPSPSSRT